jgi:hypothetical protein
LFKSREAGSLGFIFSPYMRIPYAPNRKKKVTLLLKFYTLLSTVISYQNVLTGIYLVYINFKKKFLHWLSLPNKDRNKNEKQNKKDNKVKYFLSLSFLYFHMFGINTFESKCSKRIFLKSQRSPKMFVQNMTISF